MLKTQPANEYYFYRAQEEIQKVLEPGKEKTKEDIKQNTVLAIQLLVMGLLEEGIG